MTTSRIIPWVLVFGLLSASRIIATEPEPDLYVPGGAVRVDMPWNMEKGEIVVRVANRGDRDLTIHGIQTPVGFYAREMPIVARRAEPASIRLWYLKPPAHSVSGAGSLLTVTMMLLASNGDEPNKPYPIRMEIAREIPILVQGTALLVWDGAAPWSEKSIFFAVKPGTIQIKGVEPAPEMKAQSDKFDALLQNLGENRFQLRVTPRGDARLGDYAIYRLVTDFPGVAMPGFMAAIQRPDSAPNANPEPAQRVPARIKASPSAETPTRTMNRAPEQPTPTPQATNG